MALTARPDGALRLSLRVKPRSSRARLSRDDAGGWVLAVTAPPVDGEANEAVVAYFAGALGVKKADVSIVAGATGRAKIVEIRGLDPTAAEAKLGEAAK